MAGMAIEHSTLAIVIIGALLAGFTTGFAGFGTGLVASGLWFHALPAAMVPPLVALASVAAQLVGLVTVRRAFDWPRASPFLAGGIVGVPLGIAALSAATPFLLRTSIGAFLIAYAAYQLLHRGTGRRALKASRAADGAIGAAGGFLGGFAGLSGPLPLIWLQLQGGEPGRQRAIYQPFNLIVLSLACAGMAVSGQITPTVLWIALVCLPATVLGAALGARVYLGVAPETFQRVVLALLLVSGCILIAQAVG
jgi:hypothetical protein